MMRKQKFIPALILGFLALSGCENKTKESSGEVSKASQEKPQKVFSYLRGADPKTLDPHEQLDSASASFVTSIYDTLLTYHYLERPYKLIPVLLEKMPEVSEDGTVYSFTLKKGVYFQDDECFPEGKGRELVADDVIYSIKRFADINVNTRSWFFLQGSIVGLDELRAQTKKLTKEAVTYDKYKVPGLIKTDKYKFQIKLTRKNPLLLYSFAASSTSIIPREAVAKYGRDFDRHPVGTGPFRLQQYRKKQMMSLIKNPNYHMSYPTTGSKEDQKYGLLASAGQKLPLLDRIDIHFIQEAQPQMLKFLRGELDWVGLDRDNFVKMATKKPNGEFVLNAEFQKKFDIYSEPGLTVTYMPFNMRDKLLGTNKKLRKALALALDVEGKVNLLRNGRGTKLHTPVPLSIAGSEREIGKYGIEFNLEEAKRYLAEAGYPNGKGLPTIELTMGSTSSATKRTFEFLRDAFSKIGVILKADYKTWSTYLHAVESGDFQIAASAWAADYPDAENFYQLFYGPNKAPGPNSTGFNHPEFNKHYEAMRFMENGKERNEIIKKMAQILQDEVPFILDYNPTVVGLKQKWVRNFKRNIMVDTGFMYLDLDEKKSSQAVN